MMMWPPSWKAFSSHGADFLLARLDPLTRHLDAVIGRIADHVGQRVLDQLENLTIEFGVLRPS